MDVSLMPVRCDVLNLRCLPPCIGRCRCILPSPASTACCY